MGTRPTKFTSTMLVLIAIGAVALVAALAPVAIDRRKSIACSRICFEFAVLPAVGASLIQDGSITVQLPLAFITAFAALVAELVAIPGKTC